MHWRHMPHAGEGVATAAAAKPAADGSRPPRVRWNVMSLSGGAGGPKVSKEQGKAAWGVRAKYYRCGGLGGNRWQGRVGRACQVL